MRIFGDTRPNILTFFIKWQTVFETAGGGRGGVAMGGRKYGGLYGLMSTKTPQKNLGAIASGFLWGKRRNDATFGQKPLKIDFFWPFSTEARIAPRGSPGVPDTCFGVLLQPES